MALDSKASFGSGRSVTAPNYSGAFQALKNTSDMAKDYRLEEIRKIENDRIQKQRGIDNYFKDQMNTRAVAEHQFKTDERDRLAAVRDKTRGLIESSDRYTYATDDTPLLDRQIIEKFGTADSAGNFVVPSDEEAQAMQAKYESFDSTRENATSSMAQDLMKAGNSPKDAFSIAGAAMSGLTSEKSMMASMAARAKAKTEQDKFNVTERNKFIRDRNKSILSAGSTGTKKSTSALNKILDIRSKLDTGTFGVGDQRSKFSKEINSLIKEGVPQKTIVQALGGSITEDGWIMDSKLDMDAMSDSLKFIADSELAKRSSGGYDSRRGSIQSPIQLRTTVGGDTKFYENESDYKKTLPFLYGNAAKDAVVDQSKRNNITQRINNKPVKTIAQKPTEQELIAKANEDFVKKLRGSKVVPDKKVNTKQFDVKSGEKFLEKVNNSKDNIKEYQSFVSGMNEDEMVKYFKSIPLAERQIAIELADPYNDENFTADLADKIYGAGKTTADMIGALGSSLYGAGETLYGSMQDEKGNLVKSKTYEENMKGSLLKRILNRRNDERDKRTAYENAIKRIDKSK